MRLATFVRKCSPWMAVFVLAVGCIRSKSKMDLPRNAKITHDLYDTLFPSRSDAHQFLQRMQRKPSQLNALIGKIYTAPEWNAELERIREGRAAAGLPPEEYKLHKGAQFQVEVPQDPKLSRTYQVAPDGYIDVPHLGRVYVDGLTMSAFKTVMINKLSEIIRNPEVHVNYVGSLSPGSPLRTDDVGHIYIFGPAGGGRGNSGSAGGGGGGGGGLTADRIPFTGRETLFSVLTDLGGVGETGAWDQTVIYRKQEDRKIMVIVSNLKLYVQRADFAQDFPLESGDVIYVPLENAYTDDKIRGMLGYVVGWVRDIISVDDAYLDVESRLKR